MKAFKWIQICFMAMVGVYGFSGPAFCGDTCGLVIDEAGKVGIGIAEPVSDLHIKTNNAHPGTTFSSVSVQLETAYSQSTHPSDFEIQLIDFQGSNGSKVWFLHDGDLPLVFEDGKVKVLNNLFLYGEIETPDYVFQADYPLPSLDEVEQYIKEKKHLPDIPSAAEVNEKGLDIKQMMTGQLRKIEELTLYLIELKKENKILKQIVDIENKEIKKRLDALES